MMRSRATSSGRRRRSRQLIVRPLAEEPSAPRILRHTLQQSAGHAYAEPCPSTSRTLSVLPSSTSVIRACPSLSVLPSDSAWAIPWLMPRGLWENGKVVAKQP